MRRGGRGYVGPVAMRGTVERPAGLVYRPDLLTASEERELLDRLAAVDLEPVVMRGQVARRTVRHYGVGYDFDSWRVVPTDPVPPYLHRLWSRAAALADVAEESLEQALVTRYPPGATIGWHRDAAAFGGTVVGVSLGSACVMRFQRRASGGQRRVFELPLAPRSGYVLAGRRVRCGSTASRPCPGCGGR